MLTVCPAPPVLLLVPPQASSSETAALLVKPTATARSRNVRRVIRPARILVIISSMTSPCSRIMWVSPLLRGVLPLLYKYLHVLMYYATPTCMSFGYLPTDHSFLRK